MAYVVELHLTSFGPFLDVTHNPSEGVMNRVVELIRHHYGDTQTLNEEACPCTLCVASATVLDCSIKAVDEYIQSRLVVSENQRERSTNRLVFNVHIGVDSRLTSSLNVETRAYNEIHCPRGENNGEVRLHQPIDPELAHAAAEVVTKDKPTDEGSSQRAEHEHDHSWAAFLAPTIAKRLLTVSSSLTRLCETAAQCSARSALDVPSARNCEEEEEASPPPPKFPTIGWSIDAGRYICNYTYFRSLQHLASMKERTFCAAGTCAGDDNESARHGSVSLFVHVAQPTEKFPWVTEDSLGTVLFHFLKHCASALSAAAALPAIEEGSATVEEAM